MSEKTEYSAEHSEAVMRLFAQHRRWLFGYLTALLGDANDADDVFQEVCVVMWRKHGEFKIGTNFVSWLSVIAYHQAQRHWRERKRDRRFFSSEVLDQLAKTAAEDAGATDSRRQALKHCMEKLRAADRELVRLCYGDRKITMKVVAEEAGRPVGTIYKSMNRIRKRLFECITRAQAADALA